MYRSVEERAQLKIPFNEYDNERGLDRRSYEGKYDVVDGLPINPHGRTGLAGRGKLWYWGPNHAGDPVVTRCVKFGVVFTSTFSIVMFSRVSVILFREGEWGVVQTS